MSFVKFNKLSKWKIANDITIENKYHFLVIITSEDILREFKGAGSPESLGLLSKGEFNFIFLFNLH